MLSSQSEGSKNPRLKSALRGTVRYTLRYTALVLLGAVVLLALRPRPTAVDVERVERGVAEVAITEMGQTRVTDRFIVAAPLSGVVARTELEPGDAVTKGQTELARMYPAVEPLDERARAVAVEEERAASAEASSARARVEELEERQRRLVRELSRLEKLADVGGVAEVTLEERTSEVESTKSEIRAARFEMEAALRRAAAARARVEVEGLEGSIATVVRAPTDGVVLRRFVESESTVAAGDALYELGDVGAIEVIVDVLSSDAVRIRSGQSARIDRWGGDCELMGVVKRVEPSGFTKVSPLGVPEQRVRVVIELSDPRAAVGLGDAFELEVSVIVHRQSDALLVPLGALIRHRDAWAVYRVRDEHIQRVQVEVSHRGARFAEVVAGVQEGDEVVMRPGGSLSDGERVEAVRSADLEQLGS